MMNMLKSLKNVDSNLAIVLWECAYWLLDIISGIFAFPYLLFIFFPLLGQGDGLFFNIYDNILFYKYLLDIPLSYYLFKFKKNNFLLIQDVSFGIFVNLLEWTNFRFFLPKMYHSEDELYFHQASAGILLLTLIEYIALTMFYHRKKEEKKYKKYLIITLYLIFIFTINITMCYFYNGDYGTEETVLASIGYFIGIGLPLGILSAKTLIALFYTPCLFYELGRRWVVRFRNGKIKR